MTHLVTDGSRPMSEEPTKEVKVTTGLAPVAITRLANNLKTPTLTKKLFLRNLTHWGADLLKISPRGNINIKKHNSKNIKIKILHINNILVIKNKTNLLAILQMSEQDPHFVTVSEHHLYPENIKQTLLRRYKIVHSFSRINNKGGGIYLVILFKVASTDF